VTTTTDTGDGTDTGTNTDTGTDANTGNNTGDGSSDNLGDGYGDGSGDVDVNVVVDDTYDEYVPVAYTPFNIQPPVWEYRDYITPSKSYSALNPEGYTIYDDAYSPFVYSAPPVQSYMNNPPIVYDRFSTVPSVDNSVNSLQRRLTNYEPLSAEAIANLLSKIG
tara:strand:+ start:254 stop:745 length:492 start_codon:yes stop_codon:yes gene_type:complete